MQLTPGISTTRMDCAMVRGDRANGWAPCHFLSPNFRIAALNSEVFDCCLFVVGWIHLVVLLGGFVSWFGHLCCSRCGGTVFSSLPTSLGHATLCSRLGSFPLRHVVSCPVLILHLNCLNAKAAAPVSFKEIECQAHKCHFFQNPPRLSRWLLQRRLFNDEFRLRACGNVVIPRMAELAMHLLSAMYRELDVEGQSN